MNDSLRKFLISLVTTAALSAAVAFAISLYGGSFTLWFAILAFSQYLLFYMFNSFLEYRAARDSRALQLREAELLSQNTTIATCAACKKDSTVLVKFDRDNHYICGWCNVKNTVYIDVETAVTTEPKYETTPSINTASTNGL